MKRAVLVFGLWAAASAALPAGLPAFEFRGHKLGEAIDPIFTEGQTERQCRRASGGETLNCLDLQVSSVGDVPVEGIMYSYYQGRLYSVLMPFKNSSYPVLRQMLIGKYGQPTKESIETLQNGAGATIANDTAAWAFAEGALRIQSRTNRIDRGSLEFVNTAVNQQLAATLAAEAQAKGKDAF